MCPDESIAELSSSGVNFELYCCVESSINSQDDTREEKRRFCKVVKMSFEEMEAK